MVFFGGTGVTRPSRDLQRTGTDTPRAHKAQEFSLTARWEPCAISIQLGRRIEVNAAFKYEAGGGTWG